MKVTNLFFEVMLAGILLQLAQAIFAYRDGFLTQSQIEKRNAIGYSLFEHGGMIADFFFVTPFVAITMSTYDLGYFTWYGITLFVSILAVVIYAGVHYSKMGSAMPEAHTHGGKTTIAGWIHGVYAVPAIWVITMFLITPTVPSAPPLYLINSACLLTIVFLLGVMKFNPRWNSSKEALLQFILLSESVWIIVFMRIFLFTR